jgi:hypothetical protein
MAAEQYVLLKDLYYLKVGKNYLMFPSSEAFMFKSLIFWDVSIFITLIRYNHVPYNLPI